MMWTGFCGQLAGCAMAAAQKKLSSVAASNRPELRLRVGAILVSCVGVMGKGATSVGTGLRSLKAIPGIQTIAASNTAPMDFDLNLLKVLVAVEQAGSVSGAAPPLGPRHPRPPPPPP